MYDYFYGQQAELFSFYRVPKVLFTDEKFSNISSDAKLLYGIMLDRMNLSAKNGWVDELGRVYIIFTIEEVKGALGCAEKKAVKLLHELENKCGLIERKRIGLGKPNYIYVKNFVDNSVERQFLNCQKDNSGTVNKTLQELSKAQGNNTDIKDTDYSDTDPILSSDFSGRDVEKDEEFQSYYQYFYEELEMDYLFREFPYDKEVLESILEILVETVCSKRKLIRIASDDKPSEVVRSRLMKLNSEHIRYVLNCFKENTTKIRNPKQYALAALYNAPVTIDPYVWGGSSPSTSFDCSGFVSWVINNCGNGWSVGRQTANGLKNLCDIIPPSEAKPGDLIFFQGTYNTSGASHVGIYVGNGMMIHCGDPISYASIETNYWQQHFYCFGRIP